MSTSSVRAQIRRAIKPAAGESGSTVTREEAQKILETAKASASSRDRITRGEAELLAGLASSFESGSAVSVAPEARQELEAFFAKYDLPYGANEEKLRGRIGQLLDGTDLSRPLEKEPKTRELLPLFIDDQRRADGPLREAFLDSAKRQFYLRTTTGPGLDGKQAQVRWHGPISLSAPVESERDLSIDRLRTSLATATDGLLYMSESDYPFDFFLAQGAGATRPTAEQFRELLGAAAQTPVETRDFAEFFDRLTTPQEWWDDSQKADAEKYRALRATLERDLTDLQVLRVGEVEIGVYLVGRNAYGDLVGVSTVSIET